MPSFREINFQGSADILCACKINLHLVGSHLCQPFSVCATHFGRRFHFNNIRRLYSGLCDINERVLCGRPDVPMGTCYEKACVTVFVVLRF